MWTRKELKERAKAVLKTNYWKLVLVALVLTITTGGIGSNSGHSVNNDDLANLQGNKIIEEGFSDGVENIADTGVIFNEEVKKIMSELDLDSISTSQIVAIGLVAFVVFLIIFFIIMIIVFVIKAFLLNPLMVGGQRFMFKSLNQKAELSELAFGFDTNYKNVVKTLFFKDLYCFLWGLLFVIPGVIKEYQYRMVPFILAENPDMDRDEALQLSREMMHGEKWNAFVLDISFILWHILGAITFGLVHIFYVSPYCCLTNAALYAKLSGHDENVVTVENAEVI